MNEDLNNDSNIIFDFFDRLSHGQLQPSKTTKIGFAIYYSQERRKKILDAILGHKDKASAEHGRKILENYR